MKFRTGLAAALASLVLGSAPAYERMDVDVSALPKDKAFLREMALSRVWERQEIRTNGATLAVSLALDPALGGERAVVTVAGGRATVRGGRFRALVFGVGRLLRAIRWNGRTFDIADGEYRFEPAKRFRHCYFARHFDNWYHRASADELVRYVEDLALWGMNGFHMQLSYPVVDAAKSTAGDRAVFDALTRAIAERVAALDCDLTETGGGNCAPRDMPESFRADPGPKPRGTPDFNVCPEKPGALDYLLDLRRASLAKSADYPVTGFTYWPYDEGGCACAKCSPWGGRGYLKLIEKLHPVNAAAHPGAKHIVSCWYFDDDDWRGLYRYLETRPGWIDALMIDAHGDFPRYPLEHPIPGGIPVISFPEISMWGRFPWGGTGANPLPRRFERFFRQAEKVVDGYQLYSEGIYEDINKIVVNGLYVDPSATAGDVLAEYSRWEFPGADPADVAALVGLLEEDYQTHYGDEAKQGWRNHVVANFVRAAPPATVDRFAAIAARASAIADRIDRSILPRLRKSWRWRILYLRAKIDEAVFAMRDIRAPAALEAYGELVSVYHAERQARELADGTWRGYTCPPVTEHSDALKRLGEVEPWGPKPNAEGLYPRIVTDDSALASEHGHVQGICVSPRGVFLAREREILRLDWSGRLVKRIPAPPHTGDLCAYGGRIYTVVAERGERAGKGRIMVYDENLELLRDVCTEKSMDGVACLDGVLYVGNGVKPYKGMKGPKNPHRVNLITRYDAGTLDRLGPMEDFDYGQNTCYGIQNFTSDGRNLFAVFYAARGSDNVVVMDRHLKVAKTLRFNGWSANGFEHVRGDLFMRCTTLNYGKKPRKDPLRAELTFWRWTGEEFVDVTAK